MDDPVIEAQHSERTSHVRSVLSSLKTIADAMEGGNPRHAAERLVTKGIVMGVRALPKQTPDAVKEAAKRSFEAVTLGALAEAKLGPNFPDYEPETLKDAGFDLDEVTAIMAAKLVLYHGGPFVDWHVFEKVALVFNGRTPKFDETQELSVAEAAWAVDEMRYLDPATPFSPEIAGYVAVLLHQDGFVLAPKPLEFATTQLNGLLSDYGKAVAYKAEHPCRCKCEENEAGWNQRKRLAEVNAYVNAKHKKLVDELAAIKK